MKTLTTTRLADGFVFLEGPRWHGGKLWVSDMFGNTVYTVAADGKKEAMATLPNRPSGLNFMPDGSVVIVSMADRKLMRLKDGKLSEYADLSGLLKYDINDSVCAPNGNIYVGTFGYDVFAHETPKPATLTLVTTDGKARTVAEDIHFPNGAVIGNNGKTLIIAETFVHRLSAFDIQADGSLINRRIFADLKTYTPDGICLDKEGAVWVAAFEQGEFIRVLDGGEITHKIDTGGLRAVACNLGGDDGRTLYCLIYDGNLEDIPKGARNARIETTRVEVAGAGSP
ncbi:MAG: SMP-30/gluconolactonase/LRE family protein [Porticoccaceae bacterium]